MIRKQALKDKVSELEFEVDHLYRFLEDINCLVEQNVAQERIEKRKHVRISKGKKNMALNIAYTDLEESNFE